MREILFRGKRIDNGEWLEGYYGFDDNKPLIAINKANGINGYFVAAETVGQFTGLTDKNGKKIFEGDIIKRLVNSGIYTVEYDNRFGMFVSKNRVDSYAGCADCEVLGNIYDNPELLEVQS